MSDRPLVIKGPISRNVSDLLCVVMSVSWCILVQPFLLNKRRVSPIRYQLNAGFHVLHGLG